MKPPSPHRLLKQTLPEHLDWHGARLSFLAHFMIALFQVAPAAANQTTHSASRPRWRLPRLGGHPGYKLGNDLQ
jgi:hypothetical protein